MTNNSFTKKAIRARMSETGEPYMVARKAFMSGSQQTSPVKFFSVVTADGASDVAAFSTRFSKTIINLSYKTGQPYKVLIVDFDINDSSIAMETGLDEIDYKTSEEALKHIRSNGDTHVDVLTAGSPDFNSYDVVKFYTAILETVKPLYDTIILACPLERNHPLFELATEISDKILLVASTTQTSVSKMSKICSKLFITPSSEGGLQIEQGKVGIIINKKTINLVGKEETLSASLGAELLWAIPDQSEQAIRNAYEIIAQRCLTTLSTIKGTPKMISSEDFLLGYTTQNTPVSWYTKAGHMLIGGNSGSWKTVLQQTILNQALHSQAWNVYLFDPKGMASVDYEDLIPSTQIGKDLEGVLNILNHLKKIAENPEKQNDNILLVIDELFPILSTANEVNSLQTKQKEEIADLLQFLLQNGRAAGICITAATQKPEMPEITKEMSAYFDVRIALAEMSEEKSLRLIDTTEARKLPTVRENTGEGYYKDANNSTLIRFTVTEI